MRYWVNHLQCVHINDPITISEFETFVRHPNGIYRKRNDNFYDDRIMSLVWALFILEPELCQQYFTIQDFDSQHKPLKIHSNGYWENVPEMFELRDLNKLSSIVPRPSEVSDSPLYETVGGITSEELQNLNKYDLDIETLHEMGYEIFTPHV
jgi:hypothetical protein